MGAATTPTPTKASKNAVETAISRAVTEMVTLYRICLQKNEENPVKAKENCWIAKMPFET